MVRNYLFINTISGIQALIVFLFIIIPVNTLAENSCYYDFVGSKNSYIHGYYCKPEKGLSLLQPNEITSERCFHEEGNSNYCTVSTCYSHDAWLRHVHDPDSITGTEGYRYRKVDVNCNYRRNDLKDFDFQCDKYYEQEQENEFGEIEIVGYCVVDDTSDLEGCEKGCFLDNTPATHSISIETITDSEPQSLERTASVTASLPFNTKACKLEKCESNDDEIDTKIDICPKGVPAVFSTDGTFKCGYSCGMVGNPISVVTGNKFEQETDYSNQSPRYPLSLRRTYNSFDGLWRFNWVSEKLSIVSDSVVSHQRSDGTRYVYRNNSGQWQPDADIFDVLTNNNTEWQLTKRNGKTYTFDNSGRLIAMYLRGELMQVLTYDSGTITITDPVGTSVMLTLDEDNRITQFSYGGSANLAISYDYNDNNLLTQVTYADGSVKEYLYENTDVIPPINNRGFK